MKVKFTKLAALLLAGAALFATGCTDYEVDIQKNADAIASANQQISALQTALDQLTSLHSADVSKLEKAISDLETSLKALIDKKADKEALEAAVARIKAIEDADFQAQIDALKAKDQEIEKTIADLKVLFADEIAKLDTRLKAAEAAIKEINEVTIPAINDQITALKAKDAQHDETLKLLSDYVKNLQDLTAGFPEGKTIKEYVDEQDASLKAFVLKELEKYATKAELAEVEARLDARLKTLEALTAGFPEGTTIKKYIDDQVTAINNAIAELKAAHEADVATLKAAIDKVKAEVLAVKASIRSLVFVPEVYVDGVEAILIQTLNYPTQTIEEEVYNTNEEVAVEDEDTVTVSPKVIAKYHVIPSNADLSFLDTAKINFVIRPNDPFKTIRTRAEASEDFNVTGKYLGRDEKEADVICIEVEVEGTAATDEYISVVALQVANLEETYTSDYACIFSEQLDSLRIAMPADEDYHYRRALEEVAGIAVEDAEAGIPDIPVYLDTLNIASCDTTLIYDKPQDLLKITEAHVVAEGADGCEKIDPAKLGLDWKFELVDIDDWPLGSIENVKLEGTEVTAGIDAMDLTPVVRTYLVNADKKNAQIAYIKFYVAPQNFKGDEDMGQFEFACEGDTLDVEVDVYKEFKMSKETFLRVYPDFKYDTDPEQVGQDTVIFDPETGKLQWIADAAWLWDNAVDAEKADAAKPLEKVVYFENPNNGAKFTVTLKAKPAEILPYKIKVDKYIPNYWDANFVYARYNVATPGMGETDSLLCVFHNNINAAFVTNKEDGVIDLTGVGMPDLEVTNIKYFFCDDMLDITEVGDYDVTFTIKDGEEGETRTDVNGTEFSVEGKNTILLAKIDTTEVEIAYICNDADEEEKTPNVVVLVKDLDPNHNAKKLLNTNQFYVLLGATGMICGDEGFEVNLLWQHNPNNPEDEWLDHFQANYIQPVYVTDKAKDDFIDAVDFGEKGSFITLKDLIAPHDWRLDDNYPSGYREFGMNEGDQYYNYWDYYGIFKITVDVDLIKTDIKETNYEVPTTVRLKVMDKEELLDNVKQDEPMRDAKGEIMKDEEGNVITIGAYINGIDDGGYGFLTYRNNGTAVTEFNLKVPVMVQYGWGFITTDEPINVTVNSTIG